MSLSAILTNSGTEASYIFGASLAVDGGMIADRGLQLAPESRARDCATVGADGSTR
jgi:hypothetical protein